MSKKVETKAAPVIAAEGPRAGEMIGLDLEGYTLWEISCSVAKARKHLLELVMQHGCILWGPMQYICGTGGSVAASDRASLLVYFPASMGNDDVTVAVIDLFGHRDVWVMGPRRWPVRSHASVMGSPPEPEKVHLLG